ncbi:MAG TPA: EamA family transporter, partial [Acidimicrobiales bacterium]|nr:EamA family transporter [Acidimicrobiales bacterium]
DAGTPAPRGMRRLVLLAGIWGWSFLLIKVAVAGMTPTTVAGIRVALGAGVLSAVVRARGLSLPRDPQWWRHFSVVALAGSAAPFSLLAWGEQHISSALAAVLNASTPLFAALFASMLLRERLRPLQVAGLALGLAGVAVVAGLGGEDITGSGLGGKAAAVGAAVGYGISLTYTRRHLTPLPPLVAAAGQLVMATLMLAPLAVLTTVRQGMEVTPTRALAVGLLGVFGTGLAYVMVYRLIADVGSTKASVVTYLVPVVAVAVGVLFLEEDFSLRLVVGGAVVIAGIALVNVGGRVPWRERLPAGAA